MLCLGAVLIAAGMSCAGRSVQKKKPSAPWYMAPFMSLIKQHRTVGTHMDGPRCPMYPSCAAYAEKAIRRHGLLGLMIFVDRLFYRESGRLQNRYMLAPRRYSRNRRFYDPLEDTLPLFRAKRPSLLQEDFD